MLVIITSLIMMVTILLSAIISFTPNVHRLVEQGFMRSGRENNAAFYCLKYGDLLTRAEKLAPGQKQSLDIGYLRAEDGVPLDDLSCNITLTNETAGNNTTAASNTMISVDVTHSYTAKK